MGGLEGVFAYMRDYPYACWEQKLTKGLMAAHYRSLTPYLSDTLQWPESHELPERTLALAANYQAPSGGMAYYMPEDQYVSPDLSGLHRPCLHLATRQGLCHSRSSRDEAARLLALLPASPMLPRPLPPGSSRSCRYAPKRCTTPRPMDRVPPPRCGCCTTVKERPANKESLCVACSSWTMRSFYGEVLL
jgi:hypothetical protein